MEPTEQEVATHFEALEDDALLSLAEERDELTENSNRLLLAELRRCSLTVPDIHPSIKEPAYTAETWVTVERFRDLSAAVVARGALDAAAIPCFLRDENTVRLDWQISNLIGGMRLQVRSEDELAARELLRQISTTEEPPGDAGTPLADERCPVCGSTLIHRKQRYHWFSVLTVWLLGIPVPLRAGRPMWECEACAANWQESA